jgi:uncharacterized protein YprB with RNaseH-like and TPR domain
MDLSSRLRAIVRSGPPKRELTYEPDDGYRNAAVLDLDRVASALGGRRVSTRFGDCMVIDRRYESDRWHGAVQIGDCELADFASLTILDPALTAPCGQTVARGDEGLTRFPKGWGQAPRTVFIDLETTGLSGGAGTVAFLVGCGYFDLGSFQVRQFLLTSHSGERALLAAVAEFFEDADLIVTYNGKTFDLPVMETRWVFHRMDPPLDGVPHFDMLHPARRLWRHDEQGCRLSTLERTLFDVRRLGDVPGMEIPSRFFRFVRSGDPCPLEPVLEHNRIDLVSLAAVTARATKLAREGHDACRDCAEALALGKVFERVQLPDRAEACFRRAAAAHDESVRGEALYRLAVRLRRGRRFEDAAAVWRQLLALTEPQATRRDLFGDLRQVAVEALAIHQEHRARDLAGARDLALAALDEGSCRAEDLRYRVARLDRKLAKKRDAQLLWS